MGVLLLFWVTVIVVFVGVVVAPGGLMATRFWVKVEGQTQGEIVNWFRS